jgi:5-methylcytosine-specific restriction endonuclease McrA
MSLWKSRTPYGERLRDPRWQKRRLEIMQRDDFACQICFDGESPLNVHHRWYEGDPWDAPDEALVTLCEECHESDTKDRADADSHLLRSLHRSSLPLFSGDI